MYDAKERKSAPSFSINQGNLYASTADADGARPVRAIADKPGGRPDPAGVQPVRGGLFSIFGARLPHPSLRRLESRDDFSDLTAGCRQQTRGLGRR